MRRGMNHEVYTIRKLAGVETFTWYMYRSVPQIHPPFATLALVQNAGGAYTWDATISLVIMPSLPTKHDSIVICRWGVEVKREASPNARQRDAPNARGR